MNKVPRNIHEEIGEHYDARGRNMLSPMQTYRHKKTGGTYQFVTLARNEADLIPLVVYRNIETGHVWARPVHEWLDGRFEVAA